MGERVFFHCIPYENDGGKGRNLVHLFCNRAIQCPGFVGVTGVSWGNDFACQKSLDHRRFCSEEQALCTTARSKKPKSPPLNVEG